MLETMDSPSQGLSQLCESSKQTHEDEFLHSTARNTIAGLKDCRKVNVIIYFKLLFVFCFHSLLHLLKQVNTFIVLVTIKHVVDDNDLWYTACIYNKAVYPDSKMFFC